MIWIYLTIVFLLSSLRRKHVYKTYKKPSSQKTFVGNKKPQWVKDKIIYFKAMMPKVSGYKIADKSSCGALRTFNRQFQHKETVSKTYVYGIIRKHQYAILIERRRIKNQKPYAVKINRIWGIDLTGKHNSDKKNMHILGIIDHGSRYNIVLKYIADKSSKRLLFEIYKAVRIHGRPEFIRTDIGCPWMNGRVERFFTTLKEKLNQIITIDSGYLDYHLTEFRFWYNHVRVELQLKFGQEKE